MVARVFASKPDLVEGEVESVVKLVETAKDVDVDGVFVGRFDLVVLSDPRFVDVDCGLTYAALKKRLKPFQGLHITELKQGDPFCGALNFGIGAQIKDGIDYSLPISHRVQDYFVEENLVAMYEALAQGARVTGIALKEFEQSILDGRPLATLKMWDNLSFMQVGMYDLRLGQPYRGQDKAASPDYFYEPEIDELVYRVAGVEEMFPLIRMCRVFGPCIAPIRSRNKGAWTIAQDPDVELREKKKVLSKLGRQKRAAAMEGVTLDFLKEGVLPEYRNQ